MNTRFNSLILPLVSTIFFLMLLLSIHSVFTPLTMNQALPANTATLGTLLPPAASINQ